jgi:hypothetical protein
MSAEADERLTQKATARFVGKPVEWIDATAIHDEAADLASAEHMPIGEAIRTVTGLTRPPYGSPRNPVKPFVKSPYRAR